MAGFACFGPLGEGGGVEPIGGYSQGDTAYFRRKAGDGGIMTEQKVPTAQQVRAQGIQGMLRDSPLPSAGNGGQTALSVIGAISEHSASDRDDDAQLIAALRAY